jgi:asparagine synthetase B (glutamine-hydrolysing)
MPDNLGAQFGDFTVFGFTQEPEAFLQHRLSAHLGVSPRTIDFGSAGHFFFYTSYGDVAETEEAIVLKLGLLHSRKGEPISAQQLLEQKLASPQSIDADMLRGNALVACFSKTAPEFSVYKTLLSVPQLYFSDLDDGVLCTDGPKPHIALLDRVAVNQEAIHQHFLFRYVLGRHSFFDGVRRLLCGEIFRWRDGRIETRLLRDLRPEPDARSFARVDAEAIDALYGEMSSVMGAYLKDIEKTGYTFGSMLSGGVDSTILQLFINDHTPSPERRKSFSYVMQTPEFDYEVEYARQAAQFLETEHTFVTITPDEFPALLIETTEALGFPITAETYPCKLALAKFVEENCENVRYFFLGNGADSLHGTTLAKKIALLEKVRRIPASSLFLKLAAALANPLAAKKAHGLRQVANMLPELDNPRSYKIPANVTAVYSDIEMARRSFGDEALARALEYRHYIEDLYLGSNHHNEKVHMIELLNDAYECGVVVNHLYLAHQGQQIYFYLDEDVIRIALAFDPNVRFVQGRKVKPLLKGILERTPFSDITKKPKGASVFNKDLHDWMRNGPLRDMVLSIERPGFLSKSDFNELLKVPTWSPLDEPNWFLWNLLIFDVFKKRILGG